MQKVIGRFLSVFISIVLSGGILFINIPAAQADEKAEGERIHGSLEDREILFAEETVPINAGTIFAPKVSGTVTHVTLYTAKEEQGDYTVALWDFETEEIMASYIWTIKSGSEGWQYFKLPEAVKLDAYHNYLVSVMNNSESKYYARIEGYFKDTNDVNSMFVTASDSGRFSLSEAVLPNNQFNQRTYLRDIVFIPGVAEKAPVQDEKIAGMETVYVSDLNWGRSYSNGTSVARDSANSMEDISIKDSTYPKGFAMYASPREGDSFVEINIEGLGFNTFAAYVGIANLLMSDSVYSGSVAFIVSADGNELIRTPVIRYGGEPYLLVADIKDAKILTLSVAPTDDGNTGDLAAWGNAVISKLPASEGENLFDTAKAPQTPLPESTAEPTAVPDGNGKTPAKNEADTGNNKYLIAVAAVIAATVAAAVICIVLIYKIKNKRRMP